MSLTVTQRPSTTISGETSRWNAARNPVLYKMTRKDFTIASINDASGFAQLVISGNVASSFDVDDSVYFQTDAGVYAVVGLVTASTYSAPDTLVTLTTAYISSSTGYANNETLRPNYGVDVEVYNGANVLLTSEPFRFTPNSKGNLVIDISAILRANLSADFTGSLTASTEIFTDGFLKFYIKYREAWTGSAESQTNDSSNQFFSVLGGLQIPAPYGGNMAEYVTFDDGTPAAKFLTKLDSIKMWRGFPCLVSFIIGDGVTGNQIVKASTDTTTPADNSDKLITVDLNEIITNQSIDSTTLEVYRDASPDVLLTESKAIQLVDACENPILLIARNTLGGMITQMFDVAQEYTFDYGNNIKAARKVLTAEDITLNEWEALQDFIGLGAVYRNNIVELTSSTNKTTSRTGQQVYAVDESGNKTGVIVIPSKNTTNNKQKKHRFTLEIEYPEIF